MRGRGKLIRLGLCQMEVAAGEVGRNVETAEKMIRRAARRGADAIILPEMWATGFDFTRMAEYRRDARLRGLAVRVSALAKSLKVFVMAGSWLAGRSLEFNRAHFFGADGRLVARYDKMHLFPPLRENKFLKPGASPRLFDSPLGRTAAAICFDLRFPEFFRTCALRGADAFAIPAAWPAERVDMMLELARARAIENQCLVAVVNCRGGMAQERYGSGDSPRRKFSDAARASDPSRPPSGASLASDPLADAPLGGDSPLRSHPWRLTSAGRGSSFGGRSCVFAPSGRTIFVAPEKKSGVYLVEVDAAEVSRARKKFPALKYFRRDVRWL